MKSARLVDLGFLDLGFARTVGDTAHLPARGPTPTLATPASARTTRKLNTLWFAADTIAGAKRRHRTTSNGTCQITAAVATKLN
jgi:hypothetical protein